MGKGKGKRKGKERRTSKNKGDEPGEGNLLSLLFGCFSSKSPADEKKTTFETKTRVPNPEKSAVVSLTCYILEERKMLKRLRV